MPIQEYRESGADEWCGGEIGTSTRRAEVPERDDEQHQTHTVSEKTEHQRTCKVLRSGQRGPEPKG